MQTLYTIAAVRHAVRAWRRHGEAIAFVPTMGNLHDGHLFLVERARQLAPRVVTSVFVNPLQFGPAEDYAAYPRTLVADGLKLAAAGVDVLFAPTVQEMYPRGLNATTTVEVAALSHSLCGAFRPGHFVGVATVVSRLLNIVQPDMALFGEKDYQQLLIVRQLVSDLAFPVDIIGIATVREPDGLAMSSRNAYLTAAERRAAPLLYRILCDAAGRVQSGAREYGALERAATEQLQQAGFRPEYCAIRRAYDLGSPGMDDSALVILAAAWLGRTRLIDNVRVAWAP